MPSSLSFCVLSSMIDQSMESIIKNMTTSTEEDEVPIIELEDVEENVGNIEL